MALLADNLRAVACRLFTLESLGSSAFYATLVRAARMIS
jgi:hypothetical protein